MKIQCPSLHHHSIFKINQLLHITKITTKQLASQSDGQRAQRKKYKARTENTVIFTEGETQECCLFAFTLVIFDTQ